MGHESFLLPTVHSTGEKGPSTNRKISPTVRSFGSQRQEVSAVFTTSRIDKSSAFQLVEDVFKNLRGLPALRRSH